MATKKQTQQIQPKKTKQSKQSAQTKQTSQSKKTSQTKKTSPAKKASQTKKTSQTKRTNQSRVPKRKRSYARQNIGRIIACVFIEVIVICAMVIMVGWNQGVKDWFAQFQQPVLQEVDISGINSPNAILVQSRGGKILGEINSEERIYPASMTKIMTVLVAIENLDDLESKITLTNEMFAGLYEQNAMQAGFQPGEEVRAIDLLYGAMLPSGAECCIALADTISGSEEAFAELMNKKAARIGMRSTHFCDSTGLHDPEHYSTVKDMAALLKYAVKNDTFRDIIETSRHSTGITNIHPDGITYYSTMFKNLSDPTVTGGKILGGKTGYTGEAGHCLASFAEIEGREYIFVTAGAVGADGNTIPHIQDAVTVYNRVGAAIQAKMQQ